ncbi:MAG TPA: NAD-dependent epimerase/dehydratase family protein [Pseudonocardia sp.]|jgi:nucleoside-diphosphate-sugar epimerase
MRVFLTGGSGYVGQATLRALARHGIASSALVRTDRAVSLVAELGATPVRGELTDTEVLADAARSADAVIHLGQARDGDWPAIDRAAAEAMQAGLGDRGAYLHTGGVWVYGDTDGLVDEDAPKNAPPLVAWRAANEKEVLARPGRPVLVMPGVVYGGSAGLIETFFAGPGRAAGAVPCVGDGSNHWSTVHVDDAAELYVLALNAPAGAVYAGVDNTNPTQHQVLTAVAAGIGAPGALNHLPASEAVELMGPIAQAFALDQQLSGARARTELGWRPRPWTAEAMT